jgi:hypothetical protein
MQKVAAVYSLGKVPSKYLILHMLDFAEDEYDSKRLLWGSSPRFRRLLVQNLATFKRIFANKVESITVRLCGNSQ